MYPQSPTHVRADQLLPRQWINHPTYGRIMVKYCDRVSSIHSHLGYPDTLLAQCFSYRDQMEWFSVTFNLDTLVELAEDPAREREVKTVSPPAGWYERLLIVPERWYERLLAPAPKSKPVLVIGGKRV